MTRPTPTWNHPLLGADLGTLVRLLLHHRLAPRQWPQAAVLLGAALARSPFSLIERIRMSTGEDPLADMPPPVFILGHWRSGTTHLFNLMGRDPQFAWPDPIATGLPWNFLLLGRLLRRWLERALPESRWIDNVAVNPDSPQEDEIALASMQPLSYYHALYFPADFDREFDRGLFPDADDPALGLRERRFKHYCRKLLRAGRGRRLLVKNPAWTGQLNWIRSIWPQARFIHIHRSPYDVFDSTRNFYRRLLPAYALQAFETEAIEPWILSTFPRMLERMQAAAADLPTSQFIEIRYENLEESPMETLCEVYEQLKIDGFEGNRAEFERYLSTIRDYRKNPRQYAAADLCKVEAHWGDWVTRWGYGRPILGAGRREDGTESPQS